MSKLAQQLVSVMKMVLLDAELNSALNIIN